ncbi:molybdopterin-binding protein [Euzebyella marina]|uniref:Molybdopterin-binding protein n=1 Tax=Euzebyella marina TaxID=1761453 RepID=A0A3G2L5Z7_9FLAO|nr:molybdopterin-binding protein [Euzebyella marina]AYN67668.1 molybdopterin-binding protein [Euzebyella marina]MBG49701.1 molybdopterin-binding protein [Pseudozobellia sp.]|tara:strand:+ start:660 stop:1172 length:513 start_codon:yes stop_codon:yes gene_type:complete
MRKSKYIFFLLLLLSIEFQLSAQTTSSFSVVGEVEQTMSFSLTDIDDFNASDIKELEILNHKGEARGTASQLKGVLVKDLLADMKLKESNPKLYSEFYFTFAAIDGYKVVFSWNEIFNSPTGDNLYLVTSRDGKSLPEMEHSILIITTTDYKTGRRHIKGLSQIIVNRVE